MQKQNLRNAEKRSTLFVGLVNPFICQNTPYIKPNVCSNTPFVESHKYQAFTLIELIVTLTIGVILLLVAVPGLNKFIQTNRLASGTNDFLANLSFARSEALKQALNVGVCASNNNGTACDVGASWANGWLVFTDIDSTSTWTASDAILRAHESLATGTAVTASTNVIVYDRQGQLPTTSGSHQFCNTALGKAKKITLNPSGQHRVEEVAC